VSDYYDHVKRAFLETRAHVGVPLNYKGVIKTVITGAIEKKRQQEVSGYLPQAITQIDMIDDDFNALVNMGFGDRSTVTIAGVALRVVVIDNEPSDPIVRLSVISDK
jgi:hypothetical protein